MAHSAIETRAISKLLLLGSLLLSTLLGARDASALTGADTCAAATLSNDSLSSPLMINDTTVGQTDDVDVANSGTTSCTETPLCVGQGPTDMPTPGGYSFQGTGTAPDRVFRFRVDSACTLSVSMLSTTRDMNISFSRGGCGNAPGDCSCVDDSDLGGEAEQLTGIDVVPFVDYYIIVDGYSTTEGDTFSLTITRTSGACNFTNEVCGNNSTGGGEACDDGNTVDCDGCRGDCSASETGCGDGFVCGMEVCDDDNTTNCDGCRGDCSGIETGCGDGFVCGAEACDDNNAVSCDGCNGTCNVVETGCGDSIICPGEDCDDDNTNDGDGCSATCTVEPAVVVDGGSDASAPVNPFDGGSGGNVSTPGPIADASGGGGSPSGGGEPDGSTSGGAGGEGGDGVGGRNIGGFGNFTGGTAGTANAADDEKSSGCGCVTVGDRSEPRASWLALLGVLALFSFGRRRARAAAIAGTLFSTKVASALTGADTCAATTLSNDSLAAPLVINDTTIGQTDDIDNASTGGINAAACTEDPVCMGGGNASSLPAGGAFASTGEGPDRVFRFHVDSECTLSVNMAPTAQDLNVMFSRGGCGNQPSECSCIDDNGDAAIAESLSSIVVAPGIDYYIIVDGYNGAADTFALTITRTTGTCNFTNEVCGNNSTAAGEVCDDGNSTSCDGCSSNCMTVETGCGDGIVCGAEVCDDGNTNGCDGCRGDCSSYETGCGDGFVCGAETCDDDNGNGGDGCSASCTVESIPDGGRGSDAGELDASSGGNTSDAATAVDASSGAAGGTANGGNTSAGGTDNGQPDASTGSGGDGAGGRNIGGFGNFTGGTAGMAPAAAPAEESDSGCGCVTVGSEPDVNTWWALWGTLTVLTLARRRRAY